MAIQFQHDYQRLELDPASDWKTAQGNYRRLVNVWHPDRYTNRPRERVYAQQQFIELTKAFNNLRTFHRENSRLPFEQIKQSIADSPVPPEHQQIKPEDVAVEESSILNKRKPSTSSQQSSKWTPLLWAIPALATIAAGIGVFVVIDKNAKRDRIEEAKQVLRNVQPSEYLANTEEIAKANSRANAVNPATGNRKMGERLAKDLFK